MFTPFQFRIYTGLLVQPKNLKKKGGNEDEEDSDVENMGEPTSEQQEPRTMDVKVTFGPGKKARKTRHPFEPDDPKTERFLEDPEISVRIFLSSHFSAKGLLWYIRLSHCPWRDAELCTGRATAVSTSPSCCASSWAISSVARHSRKRI